MTPEAWMHGAGLVLQCAAVDLLLSGDNAVIIAMACRSLPRSQQRRAMLLGTGAAIALRVLLAALAGALLRLPFLKLVGGIALAVIAIRLLIAEDESLDRPAGAAPAGPAGGYASAIGAIVIADLAMSVDNVIALAAIAQGSLWVLAVGLLLSVPVLMLGSLVVMRGLRRYPLLIPLGGAMLGWLAGDIALSDPLFAEAVAVQSPALASVVPLLVAAFVVIESRIILDRAPALAALRPQPSRPSGVPMPRPARAGARAMAAAAGMPAVGRGRAAVPWRAIGIGAAGLAGVAAAAVAYIDLAVSGGPAELRRYDCASPAGTALFYRRGGGPLVLSAPAGSVAGAVAGDAIDWGGGAAREKLGFSPPTRFVDDGRDAVTLDGGAFASTVCTAR